MPLPSSINDLSQTASSNSPAGSESPGLIDDYLRTYASYIAQLRDGMQSNVFSMATAGGTANAITATYSPAVTTLIDGMALRFKAASANTSAATFSPNGLAAKAILGGGHAALQGGEIIANGEVCLQYNSSIGGGSWVIVQSSGGVLQAGTAAQFDNSQKLATTAFVQQTIGNRKQAIIGLSAAQTLTSSQAGSLVTLGGGSAYTVTLPTPNIGGMAFEFINYGSAAVTLATPAGNFNGAVGTPGATSITVQPGSALVSICDGTNWLVNSASGPNLLVASGYQRLPSGLILQWGAATTNASGVATFTHPIAFPTSNLQAIGSYQAGTLSPNIANTVNTSLTASTAYVCNTSGAAVTGAVVRFFCLGY